MKARTHICEACDRPGATRMDDAGDWWHARCASQQGMETYKPKGPSR